MAQDHDHPQDIVINADGSKEYRDSRVVTDDEVLTSAHSGSICVHEGATFEISRRGQHSGSLWLQPGSIVHIVGLNRAGFRSYAFPWPASAGWDDSWAA